MPEQPTLAPNAAPADAVFVRASYIWIGSLIVGAWLFLMFALIVLLARQLECLIFPLACLAMSGGIALVMRASAREVVVDATGVLVRRPGGEVEASVPWAKVVEVRYVRLRDRRREREQIELRRADRTVLAIADYQVRSIHEVARAIARFYPGDTTGGSPRIAPSSGWSSPASGTFG